MTELNGHAQAFAGVVTVPARDVHIDIQAEVAKSLKDVPDGKTMAILSLQTHAGGNLAVAHRFNKHWGVVAWVGKSGWDQPLKRSAAGGVSIAYSR